jgi:hypothetical protein
VAGEDLNFEPIFGERTAFRKGTLAERRRP